MTSVRSVVHPGWIEVAGPGVHAVVAAADRHAEALGAAASRGLLPLLEALTAHGISGAPDFVVAAPGDDRCACSCAAPGAAVLARRHPGRLRRPDAVGRRRRGPAAGDEVVVEAPAPEAPRGWRRPARLAGGRQPRPWPRSRPAGRGSPEQPSRATRDRSTSGRSRPGGRAPTPRRTTVDERPEPEPHREPRQAPSPT